MASACSTRPRPGVGEAEPAPVALQQRHAGLALKRGELLGHGGRRVGERLRDGGHRAALVQLAQQPQAADVEHEAELIGAVQKCVMDMKGRRPHHPLP